MVKLKTCFMANGQLNDLNTFTKAAMISAAIEMCRASACLFLVDEHVFETRYIPRSYDLLFSAISFIAALSIDFVNRLTSEDHANNPNLKNLAFYGVASAALFIEAITRINTEFSHTEQLLIISNPYHRHDERLKVSAGVFAFCLMMYGALLLGSLAFENTPLPLIINNASSSQQGSESDPDNPTNLRDPSGSNPINPDDNTTPFRSATPSQRNLSQRRIIPQN